MKSKDLKKAIAGFGEGLFSTAVDIVLFQVFLIGSSGGKGKTSIGAHQALDKAAKNLEEFNYQTIKQSLYYLKRKGFIRSLKEPAITQTGLKRLKSSMPVYQKKRPWDKVVYLVTYDIPASQNYHRDELRRVLKRLGAGMLQKSVWLTPYNPGKILKDFSNQSNFQGEIIVSCIGKDGYIGEQELKSLIVRVYQLDDLNIRYQKFIQKITNQSFDKSYAYTYYLSILKNDPQLPFELLPEDWLGDKAYRVLTKFFL